MINPLSLMKDGLTSLVSAMGTERDKAATMFRTIDLFTDEHAFTAYETSPLARNIVDLPAIDSCREWRDWQAEEAQIEKIEAEENRLNIRGKVLQARKWARLFGGSALFIGTGEAGTSLRFPLNIERIGLGGLKYVTVLDKTLLTTGGEIDDDPASEFFGLPKFYRMRNKNGGATVDIHPSRLAIFTGNERPMSRQWGLDDGFGASTLSTIMNVINQAEGTAANIASLVFEAKIDVINIPGLKDIVANARDEANLKARFSLAAAMKGINGTLILDEGETYDQKTASFATLPEILMSFMQLVSGAARMPATVLLGQAPQGMNSTGEGDYKNYLDRIASEQTLYMTPALYRLDECIKRSALGITDPNIYYTWSPLWHQSEKEKAEIFKIKAEAARVIMGSGPGQELITREAVSKAFTNALVEDGSLPGLQAAVEEYGLIEEQEPSEEEVLALEGQRKAVEMIGQEPAIPGEPQ